MTLVSYMNFGAGVGFVAGVVASSYCCGSSDRGYTSRTSTYHIAARALIGGARTVPIGITAGGALYAVNRAITYVPTVSLPVQIIIGGLSVPIAAKIGYELGANDVRQ